MGDIQTARIRERTRSRQLLTTNAPSSTGRPLDARTQERGDEPHVIEKPAVHPVAQVRIDRAREVEKRENLRAEPTAIGASQDAADPRPENVCKAQTSAAYTSGNEATESGEVAYRPKRRRPPPRPPPLTQSEYLDRRELLALVPLGMSTIDALEKAGKFPSRFILSPTVKVCWKRREVIRFLEQRAAKRVHAGRLAAAKQEGAP